MAVPPSPPESQQRLAPSVRVSLLIVGIMPLVLIGVAGMLRPAPNGLGTHQQLGLPPCTSRLLLGVRCPACGMTTSWSHFARGQWEASWSSNSGGFLLALYSVFAAVVSLCAVFQNRWPTSGPRAALAWSIMAIAAITLVDWCVRLQG